MLKLEPFSEAHRAAVIALWEACDLTRPWNNPDADIDRKLSVDPENFILGFADDRLVATMMVGYEVHRGWVNYLAVSPEHQGAGLGRQMMTAAEEILLERGCPKLNLQVRDTNHAVLAFYEALGYQVDQAVSLGKRLIPDR